MPTRRVPEQANEHGAAPQPFTATDISWMPPPPVVAKPALPPTPTRAPASLDSLQTSTSTSESADAVEQTPSRSPEPVHLALSHASAGKRLSASTPLGQLRVDAGFSQEAVAKRLGLAAQATVSMLERGTKPLTHELAEAMASLYGVSMQAVIEAAPVLDSTVQQTALGYAEDLTSISAAACKARRFRIGEASATAVPASPVEDADPVFQTEADLSRGEDQVRGVDWFDGSDAHSVRRRELRMSALAKGFTPLQAERVAVAGHPPLHEALATYGFYRELERLSDDFKRQADVGRDAGMPLVANLALRLMHDAATRHGAQRYAVALSALRLADEPQTGHGSPARADGPPTEPRRVLEGLRDVVSDRSALLLDERGTGSARRFDAYATATRGDDVLAAGFDHRRGVVRAINLSSLSTPPRTASGAEPAFDIPRQSLVDEAKRSLEALRPDEGSVRVTAAIGSDVTVPSTVSEQPPGAAHDAEVQPESSRPSLPTAIALTVEGHHLFLDRETRMGGAIGFVLTDPDTGQPARAGVRISETNELPETVLLGEERLSLAPAHRWLPEERRYSNEPEPFDRVRAIATHLVIAGRSFDLDLRVARRSSEQWTVRAKLTSTESAGATSGESNMPPKPSIKGAPVLPTPLFKLDGRWNWRWSVRTGDTHVMLPRELFEMNGIGTEPLTSVPLPDGTSVELAPTKYGTGFSVQRVGALRKASRGQPGDYVFIGVDIDATLVFHRVTKQLMGRVQSHMKLASLLCGLTDDHPTLSAVLWALGVEDESGTIDDAIAICEQRSDGPLVRELRSHASEAGLPPDLDEIFKAL
ncbi:hypothetical protein GCM10011354_33720 [Egicoccus halophilus]|uniref:HTH cro/C1-type domain-containing protein n=1 Tax=Egicoccus halophilus TaxID=1670830 RepID=A0A8J3EW21_9ACTN|nr:hypothetical protein GCM10011354_33720 [Egicoccus halophilus]